MKICTEQRLLFKQKREKYSCSMKIKYMIVGQTFMTLEP